LLKLSDWAQQPVADQQPEKNSIKNILPENTKPPIPAVSGYGYALDE
jgi:hypothetical protein